MKRLAVLAAVSSLALGGCAQVTKQIVAARDFLADPQTVQALAVAKGWSQIITCGINKAAAVAGQIEVAVGADQAIQDRTGKVYTVSAIVCGTLGGTVTAVTSVK